MSGVARGDTYTFAPDSLPEEGTEYFFAPDCKSFVAVESDEVLGEYKLRANNIGLGSHVANASFMVRPTTEGKVREGSWPSLEEARRDGFKAMQFNFVVSTNKRAIELWKSLGFLVVGTLPKTFNHLELGFVDAYVMHT